MRSNSSSFLLFISFVVLQMVFTSLIDFGPLLFISIYPLFLLTLPINTSINKLMIWAFFMGLTIDYFSNSILGINSAASIIMVTCQPWIFKLIYRKGDLENQIRPGMKQLGFYRFTAYITICLTIHHIAVTLIEDFGLIGFTYHIPRVLISILVNTIIILIIEFGVFYKRSI
ncbi:MAG: hypothetical protein WCR61_03295 [Bacteroidales bacterium]|nr:hypothetical protein [Bacteroidales bacterium]MDD4657100.1 hypothetical protein [Bacteroidales bacterium]